MPSTAIRGRAPNRIAAPVRLLPPRIRQLMRLSSRPKVSHWFRNQGADSISIPAWHYRDFSVAWRRPISSLCQMLETLGRQAHLTVCNQEAILKERSQVNFMRVGRSIVQALSRFVTAPGVAVSPEKAQKNNVKSLIALFLAVGFLVRPSPGTGKE